MKIRSPQTALAVILTIPTLGAGYEMLSGDHSVSDKVRAVAAGLTGAVIGDVGESIRDNAPGVRELSTLTSQIGGEEPKGQSR